ncbi:MAG: 3-hydroxyacyl-CoA dehydrogenase family protein [SAR202 cluster bacterium]|nr:3-hydroxyacyl-CoA dehydrogenase family protein [SAR202 cluster bacterium]
MQQRYIGAADNEEVSVITDRKRSHTAGFPSVRQEGVHGQDVRRVTVIGAGQMGAGATSVFAQEVEVTLLNIAPLSLAEQGLEKAVSAARTNSLRSRVKLGTLENDLERAVGDADMVLETLAENLELKRKFLAQVDRYRKPGTIVGSCSSSLSIAAMAAGRSEDFRKHFMGIHFYNPPSHLSALEVIPGTETLPSVVDYVSHLMEKTFRRVVIVAKDTHGYAGNRIGMKVINEAAQLAPKYGVEMVDYLFGGHTGRVMPPLETIDLIGWDTHKAVMDVIYEGTEDEAHAALKTPGYMAPRIVAGALGNKTPDKAGFYKRVNGKRLVLDIATVDYREAKQPKVAVVEEARTLLRYGMYADALRMLLTSEE